MAVEVDAGLLWFWIGSHADYEACARIAALNQGNVDRAVGLLRRAKQLDPANPLIARDLARAERIAATVRARK